MLFKIKKLHPEAKIPFRADEGSSGFDLASVETVTLLPGEYLPVATGLGMEVPFGFEVQIRPRSGLAAKHGVTVLNTPGTVDASFRGQVKVILINHGKVPFSIVPGDRIAQAVVMEIPHAMVEVVTELSDSSRGEGGFGSTGIK